MHGVLTILPFLATVHFVAYHGPNEFVTPRAWTTQGILLGIKVDGGSPAMHGEYSLATANVAYLIPAVECFDLVVKAGSFQCLKCLFENGSEMFVNEDVVFRKPWKVYMHMPFGYPFFVPASFAWVAVSGV